MNGHVDTAAAALRRVLAGSSRINRGDRAIIAEVAAHLDALTPKQETALQEAQRLVHGARGADYGHPAENDARIAGMLRALFGWPVKAQDVWMIMVVTKLSRERNRPKRDNRVDVAGYAEVGDWIYRDERAE